ncbi:hypothetical protein AGMMS49940_16570 [Spirochaetia bacterium]|nr:hypothetical protein AGMMS49940_16570 [Spirochaetia bacterium]
MRNFKKVLVAILLLFTPFVVFAGLTQSTPNRIALVIGVSEYRNAAKLGNSVNDARDIAAALGKLGFQVDLKLNVTYIELKNAVNDFVSNLEADPEKEGFFWFAGMGVQINNVNYLMPIDVDVRNERNMIRSSYRMDELTDSVADAGNKINVLIVDACSNNPFSSSHRGITGSGLSISSQIPTDIFFMLSASPGQAAADGAPGERNSPFAAAFLNNITKPEPLQMLVLDIVKETLEKTNGTQKPYYQSYLLNNKTYSLGSSTSAGGSR